MYLKSNIRPRRSRIVFIDKQWDDKKEIPPLKKGTISENFNDYLTNTSLHGLKYIGDQKSSSFEKFFFFISFMSVVVLSAYFISNVWEKWSETPIIISMNPTSTQLKQIPFPAVTICNMNQAKKTIAKTILDDHDDKVLLDSVCSSDMFNENTTTKIPGKWSKFRKFLLNITQPCAKLIVNCKFANEDKICKHIFKSVLTDEGICCTFNGVDSNFMYKKIQNKSDSLDEPNENDDSIGIDWSPELGFPDVMNSKIYPRPAAGAGSNLGLTVVLDANVDDYYCSSTNGAGFKVLLHSPVETPKIADFGLSISTGMETRIVVTPKISDATNMIRRISKKLRQCIFANEDSLTYFKTYSKKNCEMECEARFTEKECGCIMYYMPRISDEVTICSRKEAKCYEEIKLAIDLSNNNSFSCTCLPGCYEISYSKDISSSKIWDGSFDIRSKYIEGLQPSHVQKNIALVHIFFVESSFRSYTKGELIGFTEFLSNTGGLLGLFMGFSVLSLVEIFYFMSLRPYCIHKKSNTTFIKHYDETNKIKSERDENFKIFATIKTKIIHFGNKLKYFGSIGNSNKWINAEREKNSPPKFPYYE